MKHYREIERLAARCGVKRPRVIDRRGTHPRLVGSGIAIVIAKTPSDHRALRNIAASIRRAVRGERP